MQGEEDSERNVGSSSSSAFSSTVANPATQVTAFKSSAPPLRSAAPPPAQYASKRHRHKDEDASSEDEDRSKLELECQYAGIDIDQDTAELDLDDDDNNVDNASPTAPPLEDYRSHMPHPCSSSLSGAPSLACSLQTGGGVGAETGGSDPVALEEEADLEGAAKVECTEVIVPIQTLAQKCLFYITAFFVLLAVFSLFAFLFLVPFVIDPAFETIFMEFDPEPATCYTDSTVFLRGTSNCKWTSCREGCTREIFNCTQIRVNYRRASRSKAPSSSTTAPARHNNPNSASSSSSSSSGRRRTKLHKGSSELTSGSSGCASDDPYWDCRGAHLYPNVKGCGYPPWINCTAFYKEYGTVGTLFSCYYSKVNPMMVMTENDMNSVVMRLIYSMAIPIPSFIISVVYLIFAYFRIYSSGATSVPPPTRPSASSTNNNIGAASGGGGQELNKSASRNALVGEGKLVANNSQGLIEMNDLNPSLHNHGLLDHDPPDGDLLLPLRNNRAPERNGPNNPNAKHKGGEPPLLGGFEETDF